MKFIGDERVREKFLEHVDDIKRVIYNTPIPSSYQ
jgi:hypothetical protein